MISTNLTGNFGDHIMRYALCRSVAEKNGYKWAINPIPSHDYYGGKQQLDFFHLDYGEPNSYPFGTTPPWTTRVWIEQKYHHDEGYDFYYYQPDVFDLPDNTHMVISCGADSRYYDKEKIREWFTIGEKEEREYEDILKQYNIVLDENLTVINCRGGEFRGVPDLFLKREYYLSAASFFLKKNTKMKFLVITDDMEYFKTMFNCTVAHFSIGCDYYIVNHTKNLILSNSGFAIMPTWLNREKPNVIAPKYWARHNINKWANSNVWTFGKEDKWNFLDRYGELYTYEEVENDNI